MMRWTAPCAARPVDGHVVVPGSKSASARALVLAALAEGPSRLTGLLDSRDTSLMKNALRALGVGLDDVAPGVTLVTPCEAFRAASIDVGLAGTVMRFVPGIAALAQGRSDFFGDEAASARPIRPLLAALREAGVDCSDSDLPFSVTGRGRVPGGRCHIDASSSSQFISALLMVGCRFDNGLRLENVGGFLPSRPYVSMTARMLAERGVQIESPDEDTWIVSPGTIAATDDTIEPDLINAGAFLAAALVTGGSVTTAWPRHTLQPAEPIIAAFEAFGARIERTDGSITLTTDGLHGADVDLTDAAELSCVLTAVAALAPEPSRLRGIGHIRHHETDRIDALVREVTALGGSIIEHADGLEIQPRGLTGTQVHTYADHRMAHFAAVLGLGVPGVVLDDVGCTSKTMPDFPRLWTELVTP